MVPKGSAVMAPKTFLKGPTMMAPKDSTMVAPKNSLKWSHNDDTKRFHNDGTKKQFKMVLQ